MRILIVGGGGREHVLAWKAASDSTRPEVFCAPGNAGTASCAVNLDIGAEDIAGLTAWAIEQRPDLTIVGPEAPLCAGLTDAFEAEGLKVFGPCQAAAQLEGSKRFAKDVMEAAGVPTAKAASFSDPDAARAYVREQGAPIVVKADGLAAGKGVTVCENEEQAFRAIEEALEKKIFGASGAEVLIEECLVGEEASILGLVDGERVVLLDSSQDHKRALENDEGPNTGGMGAYSPAPIVTQDWWPFILENVFLNLVGELKKRGITYKGVLYAGLMFTPDGPKVLEYNCRFGDPEAQVVLPRWDGDMLPALEACADGTLSEDLVTWKPGASAGVVLAAGGYPGSYEKGKVISGLDEADSVEGVTVFHAGTALSDGEVVTSGGRVLCVTALADTLEDAVARAYQGVEKICFKDVHYRKDIAAKAFKYLGD